MKIRNAHDFDLRAVGQYFLGVDLIPLTLRIGLGVALKPKSSAVRISIPTSKNTAPDKIVWGCKGVQIRRLLAKIFKGDALSFHEQANAIEVFVKDRTNSTPVVEALVTKSFFTSIGGNISGHCINDEGL